MSAAGSIEYKIGGDASGLVKAFEQARMEARGLIKDVRGSGSGSPFNGVDEALRRMGSGTGGTGGAVTANLAQSADKLAAFKKSLAQPVELPHGLRTGFPGAVQRIGDTALIMADDFKKSFARVESYSGIALGSVMKWAGVGTAIGAGFAAWSLLKDSILAASKAEVGGKQWQSFFPTNGEAGSVFAGLKEMVSTNGLEMEPTKIGAQRLLALGDSAGRVVEHMRMIGDMVAGSGGMANTEGLTDLFAKTLQTGKVDTRMLSGLSAQGFDVVGMFKDSTGKDEGEVRSMLKAGTLGFNDLAKAFEVATSEGHRFHGAAKVMADTLSNRWNDLGVAVVDVKKSFAAPMMEPLKDGLVTLTSWTIELNGIARSFGEVLSLVGRIGSGAMKVPGLIKDMLTVELGGYLPKGVKTQSFLSSMMPGFAVAEAVAGAGGAADTKPKWARNPITGSAMLEGQKMENNANQLWKIGGFVGAGGPAGERYARDTAENTMKIAKDMSVLAQSVLNATLPQPVF